MKRFAIFFLLGITVVVCGPSKEKKYRKAYKYMLNFQFPEALAELRALGNYKNAPDLMRSILISYAAIQISKDDVLSVIKEFEKLGVDTVKLLQETKFLLPELTKTDSLYKELQRSMRELMGCAVIRPSKFVSSTILLSLFKKNSAG